MLVLHEQTSALIHSISTAFITAANMAVPSTVKYRIRNKRLLWKKCSILRSFLGKWEARVKMKAREYVCEVLLGIWHLFSWNRHG